MDCSYVYFSDKMDEEEESDSQFIICSEKFIQNADKVSVSEKGMNTIIKACQFRNDTDKEHAIKQKLQSNKLTTCTQQL